MEESIVSAPEPQAPVVQPKKGKSPFNNGYVVGLFLFLVLCLLGALGYYVLKDNGINLFSNKVNTNTDTNTTCTTDTNNTTNTTCTAESLDNTGWALFSLPAYDFSVEMPSYTMTQKIGTENVGSAWKAWHSATVNGDSLYPNYLHTVNLAFYPLYIPEGTGCGQGCVQEHTIAVNIYKNDGSKDLNAVKSTYSANWTPKLSSANDLTGSVVTKWGMNVWEFTAAREGGSTKGYLVVTKSYVYEISYFFSTTPVASSQIALQVFDSMKFEKSTDTAVSVVYRGDASTISSDYANYVYFQQQSGTDSAKVYLIAKSNVTLDSSKIGKTYLLTYTTATDSGVASGTSYWKITGTFTYVQQ